MKNEKQRNEEGLRMEGYSNVECRCEWQPL
jgi:hypothetical protein